MSRPLSTILYVWKSEVVSNGQDTPAWRKPMLFSPRVKYSTDARCAARMQTARGSVLFDTFARTSATVSVLGSTRQGYTRFIISVLPALRSARTSRPSLSCSTESLHSIRHRQGSRCGYFARFLPCQATSHVSPADAGFSSPGTPLFTDTSMWFAPWRTSLGSTGYDTQSLACVALSRRTPLSFAARRAAWSGLPSRM